MGKVWICLMVSRTLPHDDMKAISSELSKVFGQDLISYKVVWNEDLNASGEYYIFAHCNNYPEHDEAVGKCHFVTGVIKSQEGQSSPHYFSSREIEEFRSSAGKKSQGEQELRNGDVVLVKDGYLKGLYGIVTGLVHPKKRKSNRGRPSVEKCKVFFSFYVRQFSEVFLMTSLEFIGKVTGYEFPDGVVERPVVIGSHVVHHSKLHRAAGRKS